MRRGRYYREGHKGNNTSRIIIAGDVRRRCDRASSASGKRVSAHGINPVSVLRLAFLPDEPDGQSGHSLSFLTPRCGKHLERPIFTRLLHTAAMKRATTTRLSSREIQSGSRRMTVEDRSSLRAV